MGLSSPTQSAKIHKIHGGTTVGGLVPVKQVTSPFFELDFTVQSFTWRLHTRSRCWHEGPPHADSAADCVRVQRETRSTYLKTANQLKLASGPYKVACDAYVAASSPLPEIYGPLVDGFCRMHLQWQLWWCTARAHGLLCPVGLSRQRDWKTGSVLERYHVGAGKCLRRLFNHPTVSTFMHVCLLQTCFFLKCTLALLHMFSCIYTLMPIDVSSIDDYWCVLDWRTASLGNRVRSHWGTSECASMTARVCPVPDIVLSPLYWYLH